MGLCQPPRSNAAGEATRQAKFFVGKTVCGQIAAPALSFATDVKRVIRGPVRRGRKFPIPRIPTPNAQCRSCGAGAPIPARPETIPTRPNPVRYAEFALVRTILAAEGPHSALAKAIGSDFKGNVSLALYAAAIPLAFVHQVIADALYVAVALTWLVPDRRIERRL